jgi:signal peptidase II
MRERLQRIQDMADYRAMRRPTTRTLQMILVASVLLSTVACDQATKRWARQSLTASSIQAAGGHVQLILAENRGVFLSLGSNLNAEVRTVLFTGVVALLLASVTFWLVTQRHTWPTALSLALIVGGGVGNLIDRISRSGAVTDFIFLWYGPLRTGIFNLADVFITSGVIALLVAGLVRRERTPNAV